MVFQRKSGGRGNRTPFKGKNKTPFEGDNGLDMDFDDGDNNDNQLMKNTPKGKQSIGTPKGKQVSFQIPGKNTPANKTPKSNVKTPNLPVEKKQQTPGSKGKNTMKEFPGMKTGLNKSKNGKMKDDESSEDDDDEDDDDDDDEDFDLDLGGGDDDDDDDEEDGENDEDDDDDDDEDDDDDDDDDDEEEEEEEEEMSKSKTAQKKQKEPNNPMALIQSKNVQTLMKNKEKVKTPSRVSEGSEKAEVKTPGKSVQGPVKSEIKSSPKKVPDQNKASDKKVQQSIARQMESTHERNLRSLYIGNLPLDVEIEEIKALSSDIVEVIMPKGIQRMMKNRKNLYAFLLFESEEKAEANYKLLQQKKLRAVQVNIDFAGEKSKNIKISDKHDTMKQVDLKKLFVYGLPSNVTIDKVSAIFPKSFMVSLTDGNSAYVLYKSVDVAATEFEAGKTATINGKTFLVEYAKILNRGSLNKRKRQFNKPLPKKMKFVKGGDNVHDDDGDDDDDDDDE